MKTLIIAGAGPLQVPAFHAARARGLRIVAIDGDPQAPGMRLADAAHAIDTRDSEGVIDVARRERADGIVTLSTDAPVRAVAAACRVLRLCGLSPEAALRATHRGHMREAFAKHGVPVPRFRRTFDLEEARAAAADIGLPVIVEPVARAESLGIYKVERPDQLEAAYTRAASASGGATEILVEELVDGPEVSVESLSHHGQHHIVAITDKRTDGDAHGDGVGYTEPSQLPRVAQTQIKVATLAGLDALGIMDSAAHVEVRLSRKGPRIIEVGARLGGDYVTAELVPRSTGVDMIGAVIDVALGEAPRTKHTRYAAAAIHYVGAAPGIVRRVRGVDEARKVPGIAVVELFVTAGEELRPVRAGRARAGYVIAEAEEPQRAEASARTAAAMIVVETV